MIWRKQADLLDSLEGDLLELYGKTGIAEDQLKQMIANETWLDANESLALGFATEIAGQLRGAIPQHFLNKFQHVPSDLMAEAAEAGDVPDVVIPAQSKSGLQGRLNSLVAELSARTIERDAARAALAKTKFLLSALERSYGLAAAQQIVVVPQGEPTDVLESFESLRDPEERSRYYREHKEEIRRAHDTKRFGI